MTGRRIGRAAALPLVLALAATPARAGVENAGTTAANFLTVGAGGATPGMGGATLALGGDLASATWNPASLSRIGETAIAFSHAELPDQSRQEWAALGGRMRNPQWQWALAGTFVNQGSFEGRDAFNQPTGSFTASSAAIGATLARRLGAFGSAGFTTRWVSDRLADVSGSGFGFDAGLQLRHGMLGFGASMQNMGQMHYSGERYPMPDNWGAGLSIEHPAGLRFALDLNFPRAYYHDVRAGMEYRWHDMLAMRAGYRRELGSDAAIEPLTGPSFGLGTGTRGLWLDYAYLPTTLGSGEHRIALTFVPSKAGLSSGPLDSHPAHGDAEGAKRE